MSEFLNGAISKIMAVIQNFIPTRGSDHLSNFGIAWTKKTLLLLLLLLLVVVVVVVVVVVFLLSSHLAGTFYLSKKIML
jgi:hypothetical protein